MNRLKNSISLKVLIGIIALLVTSTVIIGIVFTKLYNNTIINTKKQTLMTRAKQLTYTIKELNHSGYSTDSYSQIIALFGQAADSQVWLVDSYGTMTRFSLKLPDFGIYNKSFSGKADDKDFSAKSSKFTIPAEMKSIAETVLTGHEVTTDLYSSIMGEPVIAVGVPIIDDSGRVLGGVMMHSPVAGIQETVNKAYNILLIGIIIAIVIGAAFAYLFSSYITKPLKAMNKHANEMEKGNYGARIQSDYTDEIGQLSHSLNTLAEALEISTGEAEKLEISRREFVANVSHEFKTPLTVIRGTAEALIDKAYESEENKGRAYKSIVQETRHLDRMVMELLDLSKLEAGKMELICEEFNLNDLIFDLVQSVQIIAKKKDIEINVNISEEDNFISSDYDRLKQMLLIFMDNAIKYSDNDKSISINVESTSSGYIVTISDNGIGIPEDDMPYVFDRFYKSDKSRLRASDETSNGLGLSIAKLTADLLKSQLSLKSKVDEGTQIIISLPKIIS